MPTVGEVPPYIEGENAALALRHRLDLGDAPINIWKLIRQLDIALWRHDFGAEFGDGMYIRKTGRALIIVNAGRRASKQRFTAAHELGHHELHRHDHENFVIGDMDVLKAGNAPAEKAANAFAASLLAPSGAIRDALGDKRGRKILPEDVVLIMGLLGLSYEATCWRLLNSGVATKAQVEALLSQPNIELLVAEAGIDEEAGFPPGPALPPTFAAKVHKLWRHHAIDDSRHAEMLRLDDERAATERERLGIVRDDLPDIDEDAAASLLDA